jgi:hypothetical protein
VSLIPEQEWEYFVGLDERGVTQVKSELEHGQIPPRYVHLASKWLSDKEREAKARAEALQSEQTDLMKRSSDAAERQATAAERANARASFALFIAAVSLIVSIFALFKH